MAGRKTTEQQLIISLADGKVTGIESAQQKEENDSTRAEIILLTFQADDYYDFL